MVKLSVCVEMFWTKEPYEKRIELSGALGYKAVEFWGWQNKDLDKIKKTMETSQVKLATFFMEADKPLVDPTVKNELAEGLKKSIAAAKKLGVDRLCFPTGNERKNESFCVTRNTVVRNLRKIVPILEENNVILCLEPLNPIVDPFGYWLTKMSDAADIVMEVNSPQVKILMDIYHQQITEGNIIANIRQYLPYIGHFHTGGVPGRHELVGGELDYRAIFHEISRLGYTGHAGLEFSPQGNTTDALKQAMELAT